MIDGEFDSFLHRNKHVRGEISSLISSMEILSAEVVRLESISSRPVALAIGDLGVPHLVGTAVSLDIIPGPRNTTLGLPATAIGADERDHIASNALLIAIY